MKIANRRMLTSVSAGALLMALAAPAFAQDAPPQDAPAAQDAPEEEATITVTGMRAAERASMQQKKLSDSIVETLVADDVGKLPDQNVAEAVRRLPGISVANDQGEGRYVIIRGVNPNLVNVTVNGNTQPAPEPDGRQVKLDDIPSSLIAAVTVSKSITPDQDANAIGGAVDIRTLSAFDRSEHFFVSARGQYGWYKLNDKSPYEADAQIGGRTSTFGAVASVSYSYRPIESENFQGSDTFDASGRPNQYGLRDYNLKRKRTGVVLNLDWRPSDDIKLFARGTYSKFSDNEFRDQNRVDSITYTGTSTGTFVGRPSILIRRRIEDDNTKSISGGGQFKFGGSQLDITGSWARAVKDDPLRSEYNFRGNTGALSVKGTYDVTTAPYGFVVDPAFATNYSLNSVNYDYRHAQEDLWQARADFTTPIGLGDDSTIKIGAKYLDRHKTNDRQFQQYGVGAGGFVASTATYTGDTNFYDGMYVFGPRFDYYGGEAYVASHPTALAQSASNLQSSRNNSLVNDYDVSEKVTSGYAMATLKFGGLTIIPGVRVEHTQDDTKAKLITAASTPAQGFNAFGKKSYTDFFPGVNLKYEVNPDLILRGAVTTSIGRPNYPDLSPFVSVDQTASPVAVALGNPALDPYKAVNFDATLEYYLGKKGIVSVGAFYKTIDNPIYTLGLQNVNGTFAGLVLTGVSVTQPLNVDKAIIRGVEFNIQYQFDFLPGPLGGLGVSGNFTLVGGHGSGLATRAGDFPLFFQSKKIGTAQLTYEKYGITGRLAYSFRSKYLDTLGSNAAGDQYTDFNGQLDARVGYAVIRNVEVYVEGSNLNDAPWRRFIGVKSHLVERERYDRLIKAGVQLKF